jgi:hypothetical protein
VLAAGASLTEAELLEALEAELGEGKVPRSSLRRVQEEERERSVLSRVGAGKRGDPYRYQLLEFVSDQPLPLGGQKEMQSL